MNEYNLIDLSRCLEAVAWFSQSKSDGFTIDHKGINNENMIHFVTGCMQAGSPAVYIDLQYVRPCYGGEAMPEMECAHILYVLLPNGRAGRAAVRRVVHQMFWNDRRMYSVQTQTPPAYIFVAHTD